MKRMDFNCFTGNWPFFRIRNNTLEKLAALHRRLGIEGGFVSSLEAIFYQDPWEAELALAQQVKGTGYLHFMTVNPTLPGWRDDLKRAVQKLEIKGVRLVPGFQGYTLEDPCVAELCDCLREYGLPLILTLRMKDGRTMYMLQPRSIPLEEIAAFLDRNRELPTLLTHIRAAEVEALLPQFAGRENVFADISGFKDGMFVLDRMVLETEAREHLVYGSGAPLMEMYATAMQIDTARIPEDRKEALFAGEKLLRCCP
jgi:predicted TIM-barrel fold metal-dependent hydrolase